MREHEYPTACKTATTRRRFMQFVPVAAGAVATTYMPALAAPTARQRFEAAVAELKATVAELHPDFSTLHVIENDAGLLIGASYRGDV